MTLKVLALNSLTIWQRQIKCKKVLNHSYNMLSISSDQSTKWGGRAEAMGLMKPRVKVRLQGE